MRDPLETRSLLTDAVLNQAKPKDAQRGSNHFVYAVPEGWFLDGYKEVIIINDLFRYD